MLEVGGHFIYDDLNIGTPWPSVDQCWEFHEQKCYTKTKWYYKASNEFKEWAEKEKEKREAARLRKMIKARYKHLIKTIFKNKMKELKMKFQNNVEMCFLRLVLLVTSLCGWQVNNSLAHLYGLVNLGFWLGLS